jgi:hypothetical protein
VGLGGVGGGECVGMRLKFCRGTEGGTRRLCKWVYRGIEVEKRTGMGQGQIQEQIGIIVIPSIEGMQHTSMSYRYGININQQFFSSSYISTYGARDSSFTLLEGFGKHRIAGLILDFHQKYRGFSSSNIVFFFHFGEYL